MASNQPSKSLRGPTCCVVGCNRNKVRDKDEVSFFKFPTKNLEKRQLWIEAVNRKNPDGSVWEPTKWSLVCSEHFVGGWHREERNHPDYKPTIFPTSHVRPSSESDLHRHDRAHKRMRRDVDSAGPSSSGDTAAAEMLGDAMDIEVSMDLLGTSGFVPKKLWRFFKDSLA